MDVGKCVPCAVPFWYWYWLPENDLADSSFVERMYEAVLSYCNAANDEGLISANTQSHALLHIELPFLLS
jgi:hypothetical protein